PTCKLLPCKEEPIKATGGKARLNILPYSPKDQPPLASQPDIGHACSLQLGPHDQPGSSPALKCDRQPDLSPAGQSQGCGDSPGPAGERFSFDASLVRADEP